MSRAPRKRADEMQVGDLILNCYKPRTWRAVTGVLSDGPGDWQIGLDTATDRTWYAFDELVPCRRLEGPRCTCDVFVQPCPQHWKPIDWSKETSKR